MRNSIFIKIQTVPLLKQIEQRDRKSEPHLEIRPDSLPQMLEFTDLRQKRENRFNQHPVVPLAARANLQVFRLIRATAEASVGKDNHFVAHLFDERQKLRVRNIRRLHRLIGDESEFVRQNAELAADYPPPRGKTFASDAVSMRLMIFPNRMTQLNAVRINHAEEGRFSQKLLRQFPVRFESPKKARAFGQSGKQNNPVLFYPAVESPLRCAFQSEQQTQSNQFASGKFGLDVFSGFRQHIIYTAKKFYDKIFLSHGI